MMNKLAAALILLTAMSIAQAAGDSVSGKAKSVPCQACHGPDGNSVNPLWPKLAGQHAAYITGQLAAFKAGTRKDPTMMAMVAPLGEQDMADLGAFYSGQTIRIGAAKPDSIAPGEKLYRGGNTATGVPACMSCHGPGGAGNPAAKFPALGGQHEAYTAKALRDYKSGARSSGDKTNSKMMRDIASRMSEEEIANIAAYLQGLH